MRAVIFRTVALVAVAGAIAMVLWRQGEEGVLLRGERERLRGRRDEAEVLQAERTRLEAARLPGAELERLRADHAALVRLRGELDALKKSSAASPPKSEPPAATSPAPKTVAVSQRIAKGGARNVGRATPVAALETILAAMGAGDLYALGTMLHLPAEIRARVVALLASAPDAIRAEFVSPEAFIAAFTARDLVFGDVVVQREVSRGAEEASLDVILTDEKPDPKTNNRSRRTMLALTRDADGWKLVVPESAVEKYGAMLKAAGAK